MRYATAIVLLGLIDRFLAFGLGVDWGSEYHKSTMLTAAGYRMVENHVSARKTPSILSFCGEERFFENQALGKFSRAACDTFMMLERFSDRAIAAATGTFYDAKEAIHDAIGTLFPVASPILKDFGRNNTGLPGDAPTDPFVRFEEVMGMMLENERQNAVKTGKMEWKNAVFTIRDNSMSIKDRKRFEAAIQLAGLTPSAFVHENTAAMVYSSMDRPESETPQKEENIVVINVGSYATKLSLVRIDYVPNGDPALNTTRYHPMVTGVKDVHSSAFSGHLLDVCLAEFALSKQLKSMKRTVSDSELTLYKRRRLYNDIKKSKEMLSANREVNFNVEDFFDDRSLSVKLSRTEFEEHCEPLFATFESLVLDFLFQVDRENIRKVEIIGGGVRVPKVQEILKEKFKLPLSQTINGDEGPAYGAAFIAANATTGLKMKKILMQDGPNYKVDLSIDFPEDPSREAKTTELFSLKTSYGTRRKITIAGLKTDAQVRLSVPTPGDYEVTYNVTGVQKGLDKFADRNITDWKAVFFFQLDPLGIPKLVTAELHLKQMTTENKTTNVSRTNITDNTTYNETLTETVPKVINLTHRLAVNVTQQSYLGLHERKVQFNESKSLLKRIRTQEEDRLKLSEMKNKLESFVYRLKAEATDPDDRKFLNDTEAERFLGKSQEIDEFLFEGPSTNITRDNIEILTMESEDLAQVLHFRKVEARERPRVIDLWGKFLVNCTEALLNMKEERPWTPEERLTELRESIEAAKEEVAELIKQQDGLGLDVDPILKTNDLVAKVKSLTTKINKVGRIPKPKEPKNATEDLDSLLRDTMRKMKYNMTGDNLTDDQIDELLKKYQEKAAKEDVEKEGSDKGQQKEEKEEGKDSSEDSEVKTDEGQDEPPSDHAEEEAQGTKGKGQTDSEAPVDL
jgi:molecular chaperone DnaK (HSP70)